MRVPGSMPAIAVLATMYRSHLSGVAITDDQGTLIGNLSVSDVRGLRAQRYVFVVWLWYACCSSATHRR